jgi:hypothetical protein
MWHGTGVSDRTGRQGRPWLRFLAGHTRRQTGARALFLLVIASGAALALAARYHQDVVAVAVGILVGLPALYLAWVAVRGIEDVAAVPDLGRAADDLALAVGRQWEAEAGIRRLNDPYPLPVCWAGAGADLADDWDALVTLARTGAGWPRSSPEGWAAGPGDLGGCGDQIASVLGKVPTQRLVVLGEPGSGKTMLMVRLVLDLLADRAPGDPVPVLVPLASWDPASQGLHDWLAARLAVDYPALARSRSAPQSPVSRLLEARLITPVLDGLDEMPEEVRGRAIAAISDVLRPGEPVVVTCRAADYRAAVLPPAGSGMTVRGAAAISLQTLDAGAVADYLRQGAGPALSSRWQPVLADLGTGTPVSQALTTPLMASLAQAIYNPRSGERADQLPDPGKLCHLANREAVQAHLFDAFIQAAYRYRPDARWQAQEAWDWLVFLAWHLEQIVKGPDLAWWQLWQATGRAARLFGLGDSDAKPSRGLRLSIGGLAGGLALGLALGLAFGLVFGFSEGFPPGLVLGCMSGLLFGLQGVQSDPTGVASPAAVLGRDRRAALLLILVFGLALGLAFGLAGGIARGLTGGLAGIFAYGLAGGLPGGLTAGLIAGIYYAAWPGYIAARSLLAWRHQLPWPLMAFLDDAHQRGVLRQVGSMYQFRHIDLQRRLASYPAQHLLPASGEVDL